MKGRVLQIFNRYLKLGGEELSVNRIAEHLSREWELETCSFTSSDWVGDDAPPIWKQAAWVVYNPHACERVAEAHRKFGADLWVVHNVHPVASAAIFTEAKKLACRYCIFFTTTNPLPWLTEGVSAPEILICLSAGEIFPRVSHCRLAGFETEDRVALPRGGNGAPDGLVSVHRWLGGDLAGAACGFCPHHDS